MEEKQDLSELQRLLIYGLQICELKPDDIVATLTLLQTEEQQWAMADYLETVIHNPPDRTVVFAKAVELV